MHSLPFHSLLSPSFFFFFFFFSSDVIFLFICLRILPAFYLILFYNRIILRLVLLDRAAFPALGISTKERYMFVLILGIPSLFLILEVLEVRQGLAVSEPTFSAQMLLVAAFVGIQH